MWSESDAALFISCFPLAATQIADAAHSLSDLISDGVTLVTLQLVAREASESHPYGHGRYETLGAFAVAGLLVSSGAGMGAPFRLFFFPFFCCCLTWVWGVPCEGKPLLGMLPRVRPRHRRVDLILLFGRWLLSRSCHRVPLLITSCLTVGNVLQAF